jgi:hypothetical protein
VIDERAFYGCTNLSSDIVLPARTQSIGKQAFYALSASVVTLNEGLEVIDDEAFSTAKMTSITIPSTVKEIHEKAFYNCLLLNSLSFAETADKTKAVNLEIGTSSFESCTLIKTVVLPERLQYIPEAMFKSCSELVSVTVPTTVGNTGSERGVGASAFYGCKKLETVNFTKLSEIYTEEELEKIMDEGTYKPLSFGKTAFYNCLALKSLELPNRISNLDFDYDVFEFYLPSASSAYTSKFNIAFTTYGDSSLTYTNIASITVEKGGKFASLDGILYTADYSTLVFCPYKKTGEVVVPYQTETFASSAFRFCKYITKISFEETPEDVVKAGKEVEFKLANAYTYNYNITTTSLSFTYSNASQVFLNCTALKTIEFPKRLTSIGEYALCNITSYPTGLTTVTFADDCKLTEIGSNAFKDSYITNIVLPLNLEKIGENAFINCSQLKEITLSNKTTEEQFSEIVSLLPNLETIHIPEGNTFIKQDSTGAIYNADKTSLLYVPAGITTNEYTVLSSVKKIGSGAFLNASVKVIRFASADEGVEEVDLELADNAFADSKIQEITLPVRLKTMGVNVFDGCTSLKTVTFDEGVALQTLPSYTFNGCTALTSIEIPYKVVSLGDYIFNNCSSLASVTFEDNTVYGNQLMQIGIRAFQNCAALTSIVLPKNVSSLGSELDSSTATTKMTTEGYTFYGCSSLKSVELSDNIKVIGTYAFNGCISLESVKLPSKLQAIGYYAFRDCSSLSTVTFEYDTPVLEKIAQFAFYNCPLLTEFTIPESVNAIGTYAFTGCSGLETVTYNASVAVPNYMFQNCYALANFSFGSKVNVPSIGSYAFDGCRVLKQITIPDDVTSIGTYAFRYSGLTSVTIPEKTVTVGSNAFYECTSLKSVVHNGTGDSVGTIGSSAFQGCKALETVTFAKESNVKALYTKAFQDCTSLSSITLPDSIEILGGSSLSATLANDTTSSVFINCTSLASINIPASVTVLTSSLFSGCTALKTVTFDKNSKLATIGNSAFRYCSSLTSIDIPKGVTVLGTYAFADCTSLATVNFDKESKLKYVLNYAFSNCYDLSDITLPDTVEWFGGAKLADAYSETVNSYVFQNCKSLKSIRIPDGIKAIALYAFSGCTSLATVDFNKVTDIGDYAFQNCSSLGSKGTVDISQVDTIGKYAFKNCKSLNKVTIASLEFIGQGAFEGTNYELVAQEGSGVSITDGLIHNAENVILYAGDAEEVTIPDGIKTINGSAFRANKTIKKVVLPASVTTLGDYAFSMCSNLEEIDLSHVKTLSQYALYGTTSLTTVDLSNVETIGNYAFYEAGIENANLSKVTSLGTYAFRYSNLKTVSFGSACDIGTYAFADCSLLTTADLDGVTSIGTYGFRNCTRLSTVTFGESNSLNAILYYAFDGCSALDNIVLPDSVTIFGGNSLTTATSYTSSGYIFANCVSLTSIKIPAGLTAIGIYNFQNCTSLEEVDLNKVTRIGTGEFIGCSKLVSIKMDDLTAFAASAFKNCTSLETFTYPKGITSSGYANLFEGCTSLKEVVVDGNLSTKTTGTSMFLNCTSLTKVTLSDEITTIATSAFEGCSSLTSITIPSAVTTISTTAFKNCSKLRTVTFNGAKVTTINANAFEGCAMLTEIDLSAQPLAGSGTTYTSSNGILSEAFKGCTNLQTVRLGVVNNIAGNAFEDCPDVNFVWVTGTRMDVDEDNDVVYDKTTKTLVKYLGSATTFKVRDGITTIANYAFQGNTTLKTVDLNGVTKLGNYAFADCTALESIDLSSISTAANCGTYTFSGCVSLKDYTYKSSWTSVSAGLFQNCPLITSFDFTKITSIGAYAFAGTSITTAKIPKVTTVNGGTFEGCTSLVSVDLSAATGIYANAFKDCASLTTITLPKFVGSSSYNTSYTGQFSGCTSLTTVNMPLAKYIAKDMFNGCTALEKIEIPCATTIYANAFKDCASLPSIDISLVTSIYANAFEGCTSLLSMNMPLVTLLYTSAFEGCTSLTSVSLAKFVGGATYNTSNIAQFKGCTALKTVSMPSAKYVASEMFSGCTALEKIDAPLVTIVYERAFEGCSALTSFDFTNVTNVYQNSFKDCTGIKSATLGEDMNMYSSSFAGWKEDQTITVTRFKLSDLSESFVSQWNEYCQAKVIWVNEDD